MDGNQGGLLQDGYSMLDLLNSERIFYITPISYGRFSITEGCDSHFSVEISASELKQLANEILVLANNPLI